MSESFAHIYYGIEGETTILKISGSLRFNQCGPLEFFLKKYLPKQPMQTLLVDLSETTLLDSTALGLLAQIALQYKKISHHTPQLYCQDNDLKQVLLSMGLDQLFEFTTKAPLPHDLLELIVPTEPQDIQTARSLTAHKTLMGLNEENKQEFKTVVELLEETLRRGQ